MDFVRTYFWNDRLIPSWLLSLRRRFNLSASRYFSVGNAGDLITRDLIQFKYQVDCRNSERDGPRLLCVGSIAHKLLPKDLLCGVGVKDPETFQPRASDVEIRGLRGPLSYEIFKKRGFDLKNIKFLMDPGLLIRFLFNLDHKVQQNQIIFIPHYRERFLYTSRPHREMKFVDIDCTPKDLAIEILKSKIVYSSSLHGIIFSHALGRPCVFVLPQTQEPLFKYHDYFESMGLKMPRPLQSIHDARFSVESDTPPTLKYKLRDFEFPSIKELKDRGIFSST